MTKLFGRWWRDERGATVVEYGILAVTIGCLVLLGVNNVMTGITGVFGRLQAFFTGS